MYHVSRISALFANGFWPGITQVDELERKAAVMQSMLVGSILLILAQIVLVWVAVAWYRRTSKTEQTPRS